MANVSLYPSRIRWSDRFVAIDPAKERERSAPVQSVLTIVVSIVDGLAVLAAASFVGVPWPRMLVPAIAASLLLRKVGLHRGRLTLHVSDDVPSVVGRSSAALIVSAPFVPLPLDEWLLPGALVSWVSILGLRAVVYAVVVAARRDGIAVDDVLIDGAGQVGTAVARTLEQRDASLTGAYVPRSPEASRDPDGAGCRSSGGTSVAEVVRDAREARAVDAHDDAMIASLELLAHDLRSPLALSRHVVELLLRGHGGDEKVLLVGLDEALAHIDRMVDDLLGLERLQAVSTVQPVEIGQLARDCVASCSAPELVEVLTVSTEAEVDPVLISSSIRNLLENALRHARTEVVLRAGPVTRGVLVVVDDDGPGIAPDLRETVFRPLVRLPDASGDGVGLGLTLVRRAVELHGGRVWAEPSPSGGARFCVWLPCQRP